VVGVVSVMTTTKWQVWLWLVVGFLKSMSYTSFILEMYFKFVIVHGLPLSLGPPKISKINNKKNTSQLVNQLEKKNK